ncbi:Multimeric flavodoxin WrbA [Methanococcoides vulcani]|uniref:Multimeric flavodoxin WrbA n=1 Tax=Methanococcoides vulcani TaxID=1353158 RepID=A0A1I0ATC2_9EURY|nr:flavodoxin family protein [Methanococcoides vulcani]SES97597.1 Multimeric flavodoxin WrbA [Methanococcoides vulcani]
MKVLGIVGSPRKNGNTDVVVQKVLEGVAESGAETETIYINDLNFKGCQGCGFCNVMPECKIKDDMTEVYKKIEEADGFVFGSSIYFFQFTGQMRLFLDRCYALVDAELKPRIPVGKKAVLVRSQGAPDKSTYENVFDEFSECLTTFFGMEVKDRLVAAGFDLPREVKKDTELMEKAKLAGLHLLD